VEAIAVVEMTLAQPLTTRIAYQPLKFAFSFAPSRMAYSASDKLAAAIYQSKHKFRIPSMLLVEIMQLEFQYKLPLTESKAASSSLELPFKFKRWVTQQNNKVALAVSIPTCNRPTCGYFTLKLPFAAIQVSTRSI